MKVAEAEAQLWRSLVGSGFDFQKPEPSLAWKSFKEFARKPVARAPAIIAPWESAF